MVTPSDKNRVENVLSSQELLANELLYAVNQALNRRPIEQVKMLLQIFTDNEGKQYVLEMNLAKADVRDRYPVE